MSMSRLEKDIFFGFCDLKKMFSHECNSALHCMVDHVDISWSWRDCVQGAASSQWREDSQQGQTSPVQHHGVSTTTDQLGLALHHILHCSQS